MFGELQNLEILLICLVFVGFWKQIGLLNCDLIYTQQTHTKATVADQNSACRCKLDSNFLAIVDYFQVFISNFSVQPGLMEEIVREKLYSRVIIVRNFAYLIAAKTFLSAISVKTRHFKMIFSTKSHTDIFDPLDITTSKRV